MGRPAGPSCLSCLSVLTVYPSCLSFLSALPICPPCLSFLSVLPVCPPCLSFLSVLLYSTTTWAVDFWKIPSENGDRKRTRIGGVPLFWWRARIPSGILPPTANRRRNRRKIRSKIRVPKSRENRNIFGAGISGKSLPESSGLLKKPKQNNYPGMFFLRTFMEKALPTFMLKEIMASMGSA